METDISPNGVQPGTQPGARTLRCACLMMQKNEADLLLPWVLYHGALFGFGNLFVFDNGSTEPAAFDALDEAVRLGVNVDRRHDQKLDFFRKGEVLGEQMRALRDQGSWDLLIPLDCDEFLAVRDGNSVSFDADPIMAALSAVLDDDRIPYVVSGYMNVLGTIDRFRPDTCLKTFVQARGFVWLDHGFHQLRSSLSEIGMDSGLVYIHCHAKPFARVVRDAREKLAYWCDVDSPEAVDMLESRDGAGWHLVKYLRMTESEYLANFSPEGTVEFPGFARRLAEVGAETGFLLGDATTAPPLTAIAPGPAWQLHPGNIPRRHGNGVMVLGEQGPALDAFMSILAAAGLAVAGKAELYLNRHWIAALKSGEAERIKRELLVLAAQPQPWASWFPSPALLTPGVAEALRWPRSILLSGQDEAAAARDCAALTGLDLPVLQIEWAAAMADPGPLTETIKTYLGIGPAPGSLASMTHAPSEQVDMTGPPDAEHQDRNATVEPPQSPPPAPRDGYIDLIFGDALIGWCLGEPGGTPATIEIFADGRKIAAAVANHDRPDVVKAGLGDGPCGYIVPLRTMEHAGALAGQTMITAKLASEDFWLHGSATIDELKAIGADRGSTLCGRPLYDGWIDWAEGDHVVGWCLQSGSSLPVTVELYADGTKAAAGLASFTRPDVARAGFGDGRSGYSIPVGALDLQDTALIEVMPAGTSHRLEPGAISLGDLRAASRARAREKLFRQFESLGYNCEFGLVQRKSRIETAGLLRWGASQNGLDGLIAALKARFINAGRTVSLRSNGGEYISLDEEYALVFHTGKEVGSIKTDVLIRNESARIAYLARALLDDIERAEKIFVYKSNHDIALAQIHALADAITAIGPAWLLWVTVATRPDQIGTVESRGPRLMQGYIDRFSPDEDVVSYCSFDVWAMICQNAVALASKCDAGQS